MFAYNDVRFVEMSLAVDASWVNKKKEAQHVPLRLAARTGRVEICKLLLECHAGLQNQPLMGAQNQPPLAGSFIDQLAQVSMVFDSAHSSVFFGKLRSFLSLAEPYAKLFGLMQHNSFR